ncbi:T9SS type B sorting domain-containing protein [Lacinutrix sp. C3R15]|uniref:T9SS type B sorting domain-containing protein n=1 Tax=Flavobacteriaceae TaxID=49546 RepID=UPI001C088FDD|nr:MULTISPECIES: T9SS type B sorting domain-containing protein [Flavobacteriaceae]MBU2939507.1 T9SS type B sorting domain-containing protein [Lacinutrix sp. C3R15]MDO6622822.1 T9SS type B sorting domain-containing protein [Oceanihabitans sp. 1_MG-2023]
MNSKYQLVFVILFCFTLQIQAQLCEGSLGDPVVEIDFGSGSGTGSALGSNITAFTYSSVGELDEGEYTIANTTSGLKGNAWHTTTDHTGNTNGYMMVINSAVLADEGIFYNKTVTGLCADTTYEFSAWLINLMNPSVGTDEYHPDVTFRISDTSGNILGSYNTGDINQTSSGTWLQYGFFFTLESETEAVISILNSAPSAHPGNDIALDDITFKPCGPTITNSIAGEEDTSLVVCQNETISYNFQASISSGYSNPQYQWQYSDDNGLTWIDIAGATTTTYTYSDTSIAGTFLYRLTAANGSNINTESCRITSDIFNVEVIETPEITTAETEQTFCTTQNATVSDIEVSAAAIWYDAPTNGNVLPETTSLVDNTIYYATNINSNGCESEDRLAITIHLIFPTLVINDVLPTVCDAYNDATEIIDLTSYELDITDCLDCEFSYFTTYVSAENYLEDDLISAPTDFEWLENTYSVYVRIDSSDNCYQIAEISILFQESPIIPIADSVGICEGENTITIDAGAGFDSYLWSNGSTAQEITVAIENIGEYAVTVTQDYTNYTCSSTKNFEVVISNTAVISNIIVKDWTDNQNTITVNLSDLSLGDYEYSLDAITYQDSNVFTGLTPGEYTVYVRDKNGCGITEELVYILSYPKFFTPNGDSYNDTWSIPFSETEPSMIIKIFNRYGKLLKTLNASSSWDGTFNGQYMPNSDYWFTVNRTNGKSNSGHFTLKR